MSNNELRKYLLYALGEMALVVVGILIALQIDNWNNEKLQQQTLKNFLHTIARNIGSDLASIDEIRADRVSAYELGIRLQNFSGRSETYDVPEVAFASQVINQASTLRHFNASNSGYEALKNSGTLEQLQGTGIERILYDYYDTVVRATAMERDLNDLNRQLLLQVWANWPAELNRWELATPHYLTVDRFTSLQPAFRQVLKDSRTQRLIGNALTVGPLLLAYDKLDRLGRAFQHMVDIDSMEFDQTAAAIIDGIYDPGTGVGQPDLIIDGQVSWHSYYLLNSDANDPRVSYQASAAGLRSPFDFNSMRRLGDSLSIEYKGGAAWAGIWLGAGSGSSNRRSPDYSDYDKLLLELKGKAGGERIIVNMEDRDDPADGTSTRIELELSDQWQTYEIDLAEFETADLSILSVPVGFVFLEEPVSFSVRTARFVKTN